MRCEAFRLASSRATGVGHPSTCITVVITRDQVLPILLAGTFRVSAVRRVVGEAVPRELRCTDMQSGVQAGPDGQTPRRSLCHEAAAHGLAHNTTRQEGRVAWVDIHKSFSLTKEHKL